MVIKDYGMKSYNDVLQQQMSLCQQRIEGEIPDTVILTEHFDVITLGANENKNLLKVGREELIEKGIEVVETRRGGGVTAHNPGQIVIYPIVDIKLLGLDIGKYIRKLEQVGIELLEQFDVECGRLKGEPGLWIGNKKIGSIGVKVKRWVTCHGMAINICNDLSIFDDIVPCGIKDVTITSVFEETGKKYSMDKVKDMLKEILEERFKADG
ncbi:MAG: lipoyl(octanoyl) transferase LipB [Planctomycetes bacterium]|nr:lipoyl(octanoyl) transferase LipB [Planctomycetota bacterium]